MLNTQITGAPRGYISGLTLSTVGGSTNFTVAVGECADSTTSVQMVLGGGGLTKTTSAWAAGNGAGALDTGSIGNNTWYHAYLILNPSTGATDVMVSVNATAPSLPANYTQYRRIGSMKIDGSAHWTAFTQIADTFLWNSPLQDILNDTTLSTTPALKKVSTPKDIQTTAILNGELLGGAGVTCVNYYSPNQAAQTAGGGYGQFTAMASAYCSSAFNVITDTNSQIYAVANGTGSTVWVVTQGWIDTRGKG